MRREYTTRIIVRCTPEERARWKALAERLELRRLAQERPRRWYQRRDEITLSALIRQLLEERVQANPAPAPAAMRRRRPPAAS